MRIAVINKSDLRGGAAVVSERLARALRSRGHEVAYLVTEKLGDDTSTVTVATGWRAKTPFLAERLKIFLSNGLNRATLFRIDTASDGLPIWRHPAVKEADAILLNWTNQGMLSLKGIRKLLATGKPVIVTMHDMWAMTGICHHAGNCRGYEKECADCMLLRGRGACRKLAHTVWKKKESSYGCAKGNLTFVAVSNWLAGKARNSTLLKEKPVEVIPNAFPAVTAAEQPLVAKEPGEIRIVFGAARIDDPVKGHETLVEVTRLLAADYPAEARKMHLVTFGSLKDGNALAGIGIRHTHLGTIEKEAMAGAYCGADMVLSTSLYETLPGTLVEGQAYGAIPIATDHGGQSDIIEHKQTGYLAAWSDDPAERARRIAEGVIWGMGNIGVEIKEKMRRSVEARFSAEAVARAYERIIEKSETKTKKRVCK